MSEKVDHVRQASQTREHECHWPSCKTQVPPALWGCRRHWERIPIGLRSRLWKAYRPGQEEDLNVSNDYLEVAKEINNFSILEDKKDLEAKLKRGLK